MRKKGFIKSLLLTAMVTLGVGYSVVSEQILTSDATFTIGERAANVVIKQGTFHGTRGATLSQGVVGEDGLSITFSANIDSKDVNDHFQRPEIYIEFKNNESDFAVNIKVKEVIIKIDGVALEDTEFTFLEDGFFVTVDENDYYTTILNANDSNYYDVYLELFDIDNFELYNEISIEVKYSAVIVNE